MLSELVLPALCMGVPSGAAILALAWRIDRVGAAPRHDGRCKCKRCRGVS